MNGTDACLPVEQNQRLWYLQRGFGGEIMNEVVNSNLNCYTVIVEIEIYISQDVRAFNLQINALTEKNTSSHEDLDIQSYEIYNLLKWNLVLCKSWNCNF
jgi:uncharacterized protein YkuJ